MHVRCGIWSPLAQHDNSHRLLERLGLCVILLRDRDILPELFIALRAALEVQTICKFLTSSAIGMMAWVGFCCICLGTVDGTVFGE